VIVRDFPEACDQMRFVYSRAHVFIVGTRGPFGPEGDGCGGQSKYGGEMGSGSDPMVVLQSRRRKANRGARSMVSGPTAGRGVTTQPSSAVTCAPVRNRHQARVQLYLKAPNSARAASP